MKKLIALFLCLCLTASIVSVVAETAAEAPKTEMTAEELYQAGEDAFLAEDYGKAMEYYLQAAEKDVPEALFALGDFCYEGIILEKDGKYMVFDAKYKRMRGIKTSGKQSDVDRSDLFQIHAYIQFVQHHLGDVLVGGLLYPITRRGLDDEGNVYQHSDDIETSLYHSKHLFGYESNHETRFIIDGIVCDENQNDDSSVAEIREQMDRNIQSMINRIKNVINL